MSTGKVTKCDNCGHEETRFENTFGGNPFGRNWITVSRVSSTGRDKIGAGTYHFCNEKCLGEHLTRQITSHNINPL